MNGTHAIQTELISYRIDHTKVAIYAGVIGLGALVLAVIVGLIGGWANFMHAYLASFLFWFGLSVGCIGLTMLHHLTGGRWGDVIRPLLETGARGIVLMAVLFIPILIPPFMRLIYPWAVENPALLPTRLKHQYAWTNPAFFTVRAVLYFIVLAVLAFAINRKYRLRDEMAVQDPAHNSSAGFRVLSGPGILILGITVTLATFDWGMSIQPGWFSTIYGLMYLAGQGLSTFAFMTVVVMMVTQLWAKGRREPAPNLIETGAWHDLGNLLLAFTMLWGYMSLSQMLIIYSGNLPHETVFYRARSINGWQYVGGLLIGLHFALPFVLLLMRGIKRDPKKLVLLALFILLIRQLDFYYQIHPSYAEGLPLDASVRVEGALGVHTLLNLLTPIAIGGLWVAFFAWNLKDRRVLPAPAAEAHHHG